MERRTHPPAAVGHRALASLAGLLVTVSAPLSAFSLGAPICEVNTLPLEPMSPTLASPPPAGWRLETARPIYVTGRPVTVRVRHPQPQQTALGVLIWAKRDFSVGSGSFVVDGGLYQHVPLPAECGQWAATHTSPVPKSLDDLTFSWLPGHGGEVILRAFLIENCGTPGSCRGHQALTPVVVMRPALFFDGFETEG